ncbi:MAG: hypothetical protein GC181_03105 [Bacteroidetes bacterium]|nr:hypothetical protein [Bacteroidota bacterium]
MPFIFKDFSYPLFTLKEYNPLVRGKSPVGFMSIVNKGDTLFANNWCESIMYSKDKGMSWEKWSHNALLNCTWKIYLFDNELFFRDVKKGMLKSYDGTTVKLEEFGLHDELVRYIKDFEDFQIIITDQFIRVLKLQN